MPILFVIPGTDPKVTLYPHAPKKQTAIFPMSFNGAILDGHQFLLDYVIASGRNMPIPTMGLRFTIGPMSIRVESADTVNTEHQLDCQTVGLVFNAVWALISSHGHMTWDFEIIRGEPLTHQVKIGRLTVTYSPKATADTKEATNR